MSKITIELSEENAKEMLESTLAHRADLKRQKARLVEHLTEGAKRVEDVEAAIEKTGALIDQLDPGAAGKQDDDIEAEDAILSMPPTVAGMLALAPDDCEDPDCALHGEDGILAKMRESLGPAN